MSTPARYHPALVTLHWLMAIVILLTLAVGGSLVADTPNADPSKLTYLAIHMAIGIALGALILLRWFVRAATSKPPEAEAGHPALTLAGRLVHGGFYLVVIAMVASGMALSFAAGLPDIVFGGSGAPLPENFWDYTPRAVHGLLATLLWIMIAAHVAAAAWHQWVRRDGLLGRMWFGPR